MELNAPETPRILLLVNTKGWALHTIARAIQRHLGHRFAFECLAIDENPVIDDSAYAIIHVLYGYTAYHKRFLRGNARILKSIFSHAWQEWGLDASACYGSHLRDAHAVTVPSLKLHALLQGIPPPVYLWKEGVETETFRMLGTRSGPLKFGWAGDAKRDLKQLPLLLQACAGICTLQRADGYLTEHEMVDFYNDIDVITSSSKSEGGPRTLLEGMACGNFPLMTDVGIVPELVEHERSGYIVREPSVEAMRAGLRWCLDHTEYIRSMREANRRKICTQRSFAATLVALERVYTTLL